MKVYTNKSDRKLCVELKEKLETIREIRNFDPSRYIEDKVKLLNRYMLECNLKACVVAVSGGIDSAVTLALVDKASKEKESPIKKIIPLILPCTNNSGVVDQDSAKERALELCDKLNLDGFVIDMHSIVNEIDKNVETVIGIKNDDWSIGQLVPYSRTPVIYYTTSLLSKEGYPAIVCGTINLDEGGYLGYVGKASDGMVDVQLISDIHKSEVYKVAEKLDIPSSIMNITPTGDMYDGRKDEEIFGATYDFVELYLNYKNYTESEKQNFLCSLSLEALNEFKFYQNNLETLHNYNKHKYYSKSPAIHLDLYDSWVKDGWPNYREALKRIFK